MRPAGDLAIRRGEEARSAILESSSRVDPTLLEKWEGEDQFTPNFKTISFYFLKKGPRPSPSLDLCFTPTPDFIFIVTTDIRSIKDKEKIETDNRHYQPKWSNMWLILGGTHCQKSVWYIFNDVNGNFDMYQFSVSKYFSIDLCMWHFELTLYKMLYYYLIS